MTDFVTVHLSRSLITLEDRIRAARDRGMRRAEPVLLRFVRASTRQRAFRTGRLRTSLEARSESRGLRSTTSVLTDLYYARFVEFGTGRRGAASVVRPPPGYAYGPREGMSARRYAHFGLMEARPAVVAAFRQEFAKLKE